MTERERDYVALLRARCEILRARIGERRPKGGYVLEWQNELAALMWALSRIEECTK